MTTASTSNEVRFPWLQRALSASGPDAMRHILREHHPAIAEVPRRLAILGAADEGQRLAALCDQAGIDVAAVVDDASRQQGVTLGRHRVAPSSALDDLERTVPVIIASHITLNASQRLKAKGVTNVSPFAALQILHPQIFAPHMFHTGWFDDLSNNSARYAALADRLADDQSRSVLDAVLAYRLTLVPEKLEAVTRPYEVYMAADIFELREDEIYVDAGAYDGDTIRRFAERVDGRFSRAYGFEPDPATFARLVENFSGEPRVVPVNAGLWRETDTLRFHNDAGRASVLGDEGDTIVNVIALDDHLAGGDVTFIKMNIEGAELEALRGARETIRRCTPKLAIAAYHRPSDLWEVAQVIDEIDPAYDLHLRQHRGGLVETVLYGVPR